MQPKTARESDSSVRVKEGVLDKKVVNHAGEDIGEIEEVVIDSAAGGSRTRSCPLAAFSEWATNYSPCRGSV